MYFPISVLLIFLIGLYYFYNQKSKWYFIVFHLDWVQILDLLKLSKEDLNNLKNTEKNIISWYEYLVLTDMSANGNSLIFDSINWKFHEDISSWKKVFTSEDNGIEILCGLYKNFAPEKSAFFIESSIRPNNKFHKQSTKLLSKDFLRNTTQLCFVFDRDLLSSFRKANSDLIEKKSEIILIRKNIRDDGEFDEAIIEKISDFHDYDMSPIEMYSSVQSVSDSNIHPYYKQVSNFLKTSSKK